MPRKERSEPVGESTADQLPGSDGEHELQAELDTKERALQFYDGAMQSSLNDRMVSFIDDRIMFFLSTADGEGETDCSPRFGPKGFVNVLDEDHIAYPEYRGNGVQASLGNMRENPQATLLFVDWWETTVGLHVNGAVTLRDELPRAVDLTDVDRTKIWVEVEVEEAYIHCAKHVPKLAIEEFDPPWGTDSLEAKKAGYFVDEQTEPEPASTD